MSEVSCRSFSEKMHGAFRLLNVFAGSIRIPAAHCGIFGLKPTSFRIPTEGWSSIAAAADSVAACVGPMSASLADLSLFMKTVIDSKPWLREPALVPVPWNPVRLDTIRIGIMSHDGVVMPHPPVIRALDSLAEAIRGIPSIEVVEWDAYAHDEAWAILCSLYFPDGGEADLAVIAETGEPMLPLTEWMIKENPCVNKISTSELFYWMEEREAFRTEYGRLWKKRDVDAVLCPVSPGVAAKHGTSKYWGYAAVWNLLDYPAAVFPVGKVDKHLDRRYARSNYLSGKDDEEWAKCEYCRYLSVLHIYAGHAPKLSLCFSLSSASHCQFVAGNASNMSLTPAR